MTRTSAVLLACAVGVVAGYRIPAVRAWWRRFYYARTFKPVLLRPFRPVPRERQQP